MGEGVKFDLLHAPQIFKEKGENVTSFTPQMN
jgi:hypothetical protein